MCLKILRTLVPQPGLQGSLIQYYPLSDLYISLCGTGTLLNLSPTNKVVNILYLLPENYILFVFCVPLMVLHLL